MSMSYSYSHGVRSGRGRGGYGVRGSDSGYVSKNPAWQMNFNGTNIPPYPSLLPQQHSKEATTVSLQPAQASVLPNNYHKPLDDSHASNSPQPILRTREDKRTLEALMRNFNDAVDTANKTSVLPVASVDNSVAISDSEATNTAISIKAAESESPVMLLMPTNASMGRSREGFTLKISAKEFVPQSDQEVSCDVDNEISLRSPAHADFLSLPPTSYTKWSNSI